MSTSQHASQFALYKEPTELPSDYINLLTHQLYVGADSEVAAAEQLLPWIDRAPNLENRRDVARIVQEELTHGLLLCKVLTQINHNGGQLATKVNRNRLGNHTLYAFNLQLETWADVAAYTLLMDHVGMWHKLLYAKCNYLPLASIGANMMTDETFHVDFGYQNLKKILLEDRVEAQRVVDKWYPMALDTFGHKDSMPSKKKVYSGIRIFGNEELRQKYIAQMGQIIGRINDEVSQQGCHQQLRIPDCYDWRRII